MTHLVLAAHAAVWADGAPRNHGPDFGKASPLGLLVIVVLLIATMLLLRSMNRQLKKVPESFDPEHPAADQAADEGTDTVDPSADRGFKDAPEADTPGDDAAGEADGTARPPGSGDERG